MTNEQVKEKPIWYGALFLAIAALLTKILSAAYRIPYQNITGDVGFYVYQQIYPFYGMALILSLYGFPVIISKYVTEAMARSDSNEEKQIIQFSFLGLSLFSLISCGILIISASTIANWMGDVLLVLPLQVVSLSFLIVPFFSVFRGYYQGKGNMTPTAVSQVVEQVVRVTVILVLAFLLMNNGFGAYAAGTGAAVGSVIGSVVAIGILSIYFFKHTRDDFLCPNRSLLKPFSFLLRLFKDGLLICLSALVFILFQFVDAFSVVRMLQMSGVAEEAAKVTKGIFDRGQPLLQLGTIIATSLSLTLVPVISKARAEGRLDDANRLGELACRFTLIVGGGATAGLIVIIAPTNAMLFTDKSGSDVLAILSLSIVFSSLVMTTAAILQGYGFIKVPAYNIVGGTIVKLVLNVLLIPFYGTKGAAIATVIALSVIAILNVSCMYKQKTIATMNQKQLIAIFSSISVMVIVTWVWKESSEFFLGVESRGRQTITALTSTLVGGICFAYVLLRLQVFSEKEIKVIPKLEKVVYWLKLKRGE